MSKHEDDRERPRRERPERERRRRVPAPPPVEPDPPPREGAAFDPTAPDSWGERAKEVADRFLGLPGAPDWFAGITRPTVIWFEATATTFIRGQSTSEWAREVARVAKALGYQGFGNGLP